MTEHKRLFGLLPIPVRRRSTLGEVPGSDVPSVVEHTGSEPKTAEQFEKLTTELNGNVPFPTLVEQLKQAEELKIPVQRVITVPFRDSQGWKIVAGVAGVTLTVVAAVGIYDRTKKILEARNKTRR